MVIALLLEPGFLCLVLRGVWKLLLIGTVFFGWALPWSMNWPHMFTYTLKSDVFNWTFWWAQVILKLFAEIDFFSLQFFWIWYFLGNWKLIWQLSTALKLSFISQYKYIVPCHAVTFVSKSGKTPHRKKYFIWVNNLKFYVLLSRSLNTSLSLLPVFLNTVNAHTFIALQEFPNWQIVKCF